MSNRNTAIFAAAVVLIWALVGFGGGDGGDGAIIDGIPFPASMKVAGARQQLAGGGTRTKYNVVKVYAVGLYLENQYLGPNGGLKAFAQTPGAKLASTPAFFDALIKGRAAKTLLLIFHRSVGTEAVAGALKDALGKRVAPAVLDKFHAALSTVLGEQVAKGASLHLSCSADKLIIDSGAVAAVSLREKALCPSLFEVYLGKSPVSPAAKEGVAKGYASRLAQRS